MTGPASDEKRYPGLDVARAIFMMLGVAFHTAAIYAINGKWRLVAADRSAVFDLLMNINRSFRMEGFFLISGFFLPLLIAKRGRPGTLRNRAARLGIPLLVVGFTLNFAANELSDFVKFPYDWNYFLRGRWMGHLWFLGALILFIALTLPFLKRPAASSVSRGRFFLLFTVLSLLVVPAASVLLSYTARQVVSAPVLIFNLVLAGKYFPYFVLGIFLWCGRRHWENSVTWKFVAVAAGVFLILRAGVGPAGSVHYLAGRIFLQASSSVLCLGVIAAISLVSIPRKLLTFCVEISYTVYLLHQPLILALFVAFRPLQLNAFAGFSLICAMTLLITAAAHVFFRKSSLLMMLFNGVLPHEFRARENSRAGDEPADLARPA